MSRVLAPASAVLVDRLHCISVDGHDIALTRVDGQPVAFLDRCPHAGARLSAGDYGRGRVTCASHGWKIDVVSGFVRWPRDEIGRLQTFAVCEIDGQIVLDQPEL